MATGPNARPLRGTPMSILEIADLKKMAKKRVPKMFFDYADSGAWTESTYRANEEDFQKIKLRQRVLVDMSNRSLETTMIGEKVSMPVALAPTGMTGMQHPDGEILAAQAAEEFGVPFTLSTMSICSIEDVARETKKPFWFQLYVLRDKDFVFNLIDRAKAAKCSALVLTLDLQILGQRHKDLRNGLSAPPKFTPKHIWQVATRPRWALGMLGTKRRTFRNIVGHAKGVGDLASLSSWTTEQFDPHLSWKDVEWIKERWGGKLILKGINDVEDARMAVEHRRRRHHRLQPRRPPARRRAVVDLDGRADRRCGRRQARGAHGRRHPLRPGRAEGALPGRQGHLYRPAVPLRARRDGQGRRHQGAGDHPQGDGHDAGALRQAADHRRGQGDAA